MLEELDRELDGMREVKREMQECQMLREDMAKNKQNKCVWSV